MEVRPCPHGRGLFALRDLRAGQVILRTAGLVLTATPRSPPEKGWALRVGEKEYWDEEPRQSPLYWTNFVDHSGRPNSRFYFDKEKPSVTFKALRSVEKGEEIFIDYREY